MITNIIVALISLVIIFLLGYKIFQVRNLSRKIKIISKERDDLKLSVEVAIGRAEGQQNLAEEIINESNAEKESLEEQLDQAIEKHRVILHELQDFKIALELCMRKLAKEVKKTPFNPNLFSRVLKDVGDGNVTLIGDGYDFSNQIQ